MRLFVTCPVRDVERATALHHLGVDIGSADVGPQRVALHHHARPVRDARQPRDVRQRRSSEELIGGPDTPSKVTVSFDLGSRGAVDELLDRADEAGGRIGDTDDYPFMYQRQFHDLDGYHYSPFWMKPDTEPGA